MLVLATNAQSHSVQFLQHLVNAGAGGADCDRLDRFTPVAGKQDVRCSACLWCLVFLAAVLPGNFVLVCLVW